MSPHNTVILGFIVMALLALGAVLENWRDRRRMTPEDQAAAQSWLIALAVAFFIFLVMTAVAFAHDHARADLNSWFKQLKTHRGYCCDGISDALHLRDVDWEVREGHYRVRIPKNGSDMARAVAGEAVETEWVDVPDEAVLDEPNRDGATLVWPLYGYMGSSIRCFMPGSMT